MKTLILATVNYGKAQITQSWEFLLSEGEPYLVLHEAHDGKIVIPLDADKIKEMTPGITPRHVFHGTLKASDAINLENK
jgi:hypothetical protein